MQMIRRATRKSPVLRNAEYKIPAVFTHPPCLCSPLTGHTESSPGVSLVPGLLRLDGMQPGLPGSQEGDPVGIDDLSHRAALPDPRGLLCAP